MVVTTLALKPGQQAALDATIDAFAAAHAHVQAVCRREASADKALIYQQSRQVLYDRFGLGEDLAFQAVEEACLHLGSAGLIAYRTPVVSYGPVLCRLNARAGTVSLPTVAGRLTRLPVRADAWQRQLLSSCRIMRAVLRRDAAGRHLLILSLTPRNMDGATG